MNAKFVCKLCQQILKTPILLPCNKGCQICKEHVDGQKFQCKLCRNFHFLYECMENINLKFELEQLAHLNDEEKCFKLSLEAILKEIFNIYEEMSIKFNELSLIQYEHFANIKNEIDIKRETLLNELTHKIETNPSRHDEIHKQSVQMIKRVEYVENSFRNNYNLNLKLKLDLIKENILKINIDQYFRVPMHLTSEYLTNLKIKCESKLEKLKRKLENLKLIEYDLKRNKFVQEKCFDMNGGEFGYLVLYEDFVVDFEETQLQNILTCWYNKREINFYNLNKGFKIDEFNDDSSPTMEGVWCIIFYEKDKFISSGEDKSIKVWQMNQQKYIRQFKGHSREVWCLKLLNRIDDSQHQRLASGSFDRTIKIWDLIESVCLFTLKTDSESVSCLEQLDNDYLVSGSYCLNPKTIMIWDLNNRACVNILKGHSNGVTCLKRIKVLDFLNNEGIASGSADETIKIWNSLSGECVQTLMGHTRSIFSLEFTSNSLLVSSSADKTIRVWNSLKGWQCVHVLNGHTDNVYCLKINAMGQLVSGSSDKSIMIWNLDTGECLNKIHTDSCIYRFELF